ncbi:MAG: DUF3343 domain-containing protein [Chloroflexi bacterium]|nr:DUF3343 domain-containing protein [Chloroflexota bacterium]
MIEDRYAVILVYGTSHAIRAEKVLHQAGIASKLIPVPRHLSSNCGVCLRIERTDQDRSLDALVTAQLQIEGVHEV